MSRHYTLDEIMALEPCYSREELKKYFPNGTITASQITEADISHLEKLWVLVRLLRPEDFVTFACDCAERVLHLFENKFPNDDRPRKAIEAARSGDKAAAWDASDAAGDASWDVRDSAWDAAVAARAASFAAGAAGAVAGAAGAAVDAEGAADAALDAANTANAEGAAEQEWQLNRLLELVHGAEQSGNQPF